MTKKQEAKKAKGPQRVGITELVEAIAAKMPGVTKKTVDEVVHATIKAISDNLVKRNTVAFTGTFTLEPALKAARTGRNPQDPSKVIDIPEHWSVRLKVGNTLKVAMNS